MMMTTRIDTKAQEKAPQPDFIPGAIPGNSYEFLKTPELLKSIIEWAVGLMSADAGEIFLWDSEKEELKMSISIGFLVTYTGVRLKSGEGMAGRVFQSGEPMIVDDYVTWNGGSTVFSPHPPFITVLEVPMRWQDRIIGVLAIDADSRLRKFNQDDVRLASLFGNVAAAAIENARLYEELQDRATKIQYTLEQKVEARTAELAYRALQLELSAQVSREITSILDVDKLLNRVVTLISEAFGYCYVLIFLIDNTSDRLALKAGAGDIDWQSVNQGKDIEILPGSINDEVAQNNEALLINNVKQVERDRVHKLLPNTRSELAVPLRVGQKVVGTLDVHCDRENAFTQEDALVIQSLGDQIAIAIENARLYEHSRELAVLEERNRLARELHDSVTQSLYSLTLLAETGRRAAKAQDLERVVHHQVRLGEIAQQALKEMRLLVYELRPSALEEEGLVGALKQRLDAVEGRAGVETCLIVKGRVELPPTVEVALYRIAQEALNNALKHAYATSVTVKVSAGEGIVELTVTDDGRGFNLEGVDQMGGMGLATMRERAERENGTLRILSSPGQGTVVKVTLEMSQNYEVEQEYFDDQRDDTCFNCR